MITRILLTAFILLTGHTRAAVQMSALFSDHMVLQSGMGVPIWGKATNGARIVVEMPGQKVETVADATGRWRVMLDAMQPASKPQTMKITGDGWEKVIQDILIGEVWLGSGQSNMAMTTGRAKDFEKEQSAAKWPEIRYFTTVRQSAPTPMEECEGEWKVCSPETVATFSATGYFFARELHRELKVPVGMVISSVGGTPIDAWVDADKQRALPELKPLFAPDAGGVSVFDAASAKADYEAAREKWKADAKKARAEGKTPPRPPRDPVATHERKSNVGGLFNGMIMPLVPMALRGVIWYQGEANTVPQKAHLYQHQLPLLVTDWRARWGRELPVAWVQLPNFLGNGRDLPAVREGMAKTLRLPHTGMAVTIDIGETKDIHPKNKQEVGRRLSLWALHDVYGKEDAVSRGPSFSSFAVKDAGIVITLKDADGLRTREGAEIPGFQVAGEDKVWKPAQARLEGGTIILTSKEAPVPVAIRYAWENDPKVNLVNAAGLPLSPFRTDAW